MSKEYTTDNIYIDGYLSDGSGSGTSGQVLSSTGGGVSWVDGSGTIIGGPYLPLSAGSTKPLTDTLYLPDTHGVRWTSVGGSEIKSYSDIINVRGYYGVVIYSALSTSDIVFTNNQSGELMRVKGTGNVGIGETSPGVKLQLVSADEQLTKFSSSVADQLAYSQINASSSTSGVITAAAALELVGKANASGHGRHAWIGAEGTPNTNTKTKLKFKIRGETASGYDWTGAAEAPTIMTLEGDGNVGIGTTNPAGKLHVNAGTNRNLRITNGVQSTTGIDIQSLNDAANTNMPLTLSGSLIAMMEGNVGIGTTSPGYKLDVAGDGYYTGQLTVDGFTNDSGISFRKGFSPTNVGIRAKAITTANRDGLELLGYNGIDFTINNGANVAMRINGQGNTGNVGNVGIGNTNPQAPLSFANSVGNKIDFYHNIADNDRYGIQVQSNELRIHSGASGSNSGGITFGKSTTTTFTESMRITNAGNVGIGTDSPSAKLEVKTSGFNTTIELDNSDTQYSVIQHNALGAVKGFTGYNSGFMIYGGESGVTTRLQAGGAYAATILTNGNFGIGTTSPSYKLEVNGGTTLVGGGFHVSTDQTIITSSSYTFRDGVYINNPNSSSAAASSTAVMSIGAMTSGTSLITTGNVGIGTASPAAKLHSVITSNGFNPSLTYNTSAAAIVENWGVQLAMGVDTVNSQTFYLQARQSANTSWPMSLNPLGGNVGIGTTSPDSKLDVTGGDITVNTSGTGFMNFKYGAVGSETARGSITTDGIDLKVNATADLLLLPSGNVGIGTASPTNGKLVINSTANQIAIETGTAGDGRLNIGHFANGTFIGTYGDDGGVADIIRFGTHSGDERMRITSAGNVGIGTTNINFSNGSGLVIGSSGAARLKIANSNTGYGATNGFELIQSGLNSYVFNYEAGPMYFGTSSSTRMTILSGGNVGIGTASPSSALSISKSMGAAFIADFINPAVNGHGLLIQAGGTTGTRYITQWKDALGTERFHMEDDGEAYFQGNVGIGTTSPSGKLDVQGGEVMFSINTANKDTFLFTTGAADKGILNIKDDTTIKVKLNTNGDSYLNGGNVGIGTTNPTAPLEVNVTGAGDVFKLTRDTGTNGELNIDFAGANTNFNSEQGGFNFETSSTGNALTILSAGNVGIGTGVPSYTLEVNGKIATNNGGIVIESQDIYSNSEYSGDDGSVRINRLGYLGGTTKFRDTVIFNGRGSKIMTIDGSSGNVGIGTTTPSTKLQVNGRIKADEGVQVGNETSTAASLALVGTLRYRGAIAAGLNTVSVVEMCMQVSAGPTYAWKAIYTTPSW